MASLSSGFTRVIFVKGWATRRVAVAGLLPSTERAVMVTVPRLTPVMSPESSILAMPLSEDSQVTLWLVAFAGSKRTLKRVVPPTLMTFSSGLRLIAVTWMSSAMTWMLHVAETPPQRAVISASPTPTAFTSPPSTLATLFFELSQVTVLFVAFDGSTVAYS